MAGLVLGGIALGTVLAGAPADIVLGTMAALLAIGAAVYSPALGLAVLAFTYPYDLVTYAGPVKLTTSYVLLAILVLVWAGREILPNAPAWRRTPLDWPVALFGVATVLSLLGLTGNYSDQVIAIVKAGGGFVLFFLATQGLRSRRDVWIVVGAIILTGLIQAMITIGPVLTGSIVVSDTTRATGNADSANIFAGYLVLVAPLGLAAMLAVRQRWFTAAGAVATLIFGMALVATLSRSGWIGFVVALITLVVLLPGRRREIALVGAAVLAVLIMVGLAGPIAGRLGDQQGSSPFQTFMDRIPIWSAALGMFAQHPIFGIGVNNFSYLLPAYDSDLDVNQAHNLFLNIAAERGILGFVTFLFVLAALAATLRSAFRVASAPPYRVLTVGIIASLAGFLAHSLFDVSYYDYKILLLFWLLVGIAAGLPRLFMPTQAA